MPYVSIKTKIMTITLLVAFIPGIIGVASTYIKGTQVFEKSIGNKFLGVAKQAAILVDTLIEKEVSELGLISNNIEIKNLILGKGHNRVEITRILEDYISSEGEKSATLCREIGW